MFLYSAHPSTEGINNKVEYFYPYIDNLLPYDEKPFCLFRANYLESNMIILKDRFARILQPTKAFGLSLAIMSGEDTEGSIV
jgi:hypothetical protein